MKFKYLVVLVSNSHLTLLYNNLLHKGCKIELISAPSDISRGCTKAIRFDESDTDIVIQEIKNSKLIVKGFYKIVNESNRTSYVLIS
ncbi:DUF3343 domain-containing protein [Clostridium estertheticum]|uniref:DUF3343 domain-containing protein n=1 Tax=Clostridium estertheticum TaxID=238834 RepID=UPI0013E96488|nr:DUF3343 domain-containing protein [Clostridium estertheticum]MBZ9686390.1 DUF3343 domain-containing protein [Clostridium estertheticum]